MAKNQAKQDGMSARRLAAFLRVTHACRQARQWARGKTLREAWETCPKGAWMIWLVGTVGTDVLLKGKIGRYRALMRWDTRAWRAITSRTERLEHRGSPRGEIDAYADQAYSRQEKRVAIRMRKLIPAQKIVEVLATVDR